MILKQNKINEKKVKYVVKQERKSRLELLKKVTVLLFESLIHLLHCAALAPHETHSSTIVVQAVL